MNCPSCGYATDPGARYCASCGTLLDSAAPAGERRQLTVLMCDIVESTALSQQHDPEDLHRLMSSFQLVCQRAADRLDGYVSQFLGDGVQIYFGFPRAHEDDARRGVDCALAILEGLDELRSNAAVPLAARLRVRAGVHTGRVVVGSVGAGMRRENIALGDGPNIAARVQASAEPGTLWATEATWRLVENHFHGVAQGERQLKGLSVPLRLWSVARRPADPQPAPASAHQRVYVGRRTEHATLQTHWALARMGKARFVGVRGEPGIGKSRLIEEFELEAASAPGSRLSVRCTPYATHSAFLPLVELLQRELATAAGTLVQLEAWLATLGIAGGDEALLLGELLSLPVGERMRALGLSPARRRTRTIETLVAVIESIASRRPTMLVVEDLHWADASTIEVLEQLVARGARLPLLGLFTARPEFEFERAAFAAVELLEVPRLDGAEVDALVRHVAHGKVMPGEVIREIVSRGDGVPLFIEEMARAVIEAGVLEEQEYAWALVGALPHELIPASVDASLMSRIDRLGDARPTAQLAATLGREFTYAQLRAVSDRDEAELRADLARLVDSGMAWNTSARDGEAYVFKHVLVQMAAYESLLRSTRQRFHDRIARVLMADFRTEAAHRPEAIARHLSGAGRHAEASDHWFAAGQAALARVAVPEAHGHYMRALDDLSRLPESDDMLAKELDLRIAIAPTLMTLHGWASPTVAQACERARELCRRLNRPDKLYAPIWGLWTNLFVGGQLDRALEVAREALAMARGSGVTMLEVTGRHAMAYSHYYRGEWDAAIEHAGAGIALYALEQERALTQTFQISSTVNMVAALGSSLWMTGHQERGLAEMDRMIAMARDINHPSALSNALGVACYMLTFHHDAPRMLRHAAEVKGFARAEGWELWYAVGVMSSGWARLRLGDREDGLRELFEGVALFRATRSDLMGPTVGVIHAEGLRAAGRADEALEMLEATAATAQRGHVGLLLPDVHRLIGELHAAAGRFAPAQAAFEAALDCARAQRALSLELRAAVAYHALLQELGRADEGIARVRECYDRFPASHDQPELRAARALLAGVPH